MAEALSVIAIVLYIAAAIFAALAVTFWFLFKIPSIVGEFSGRTTRKSIEKMRANNEKTGEKTYRSSRENIRRGKLTETMQPADSPSGTNQQGRVPRSSPQADPPTEVFFAEEKTHPQDRQIATEPLDSSSMAAAEPLDSSGMAATEPLDSSSMAATESLDSSDIATQVLDSSHAAAESQYSGSKPAARKKSSVQLDMLEEIQYLHTDETI